MVCGFPYQYIGYYLEVEGKIDVDRFRAAYDDEMFQCIDRVYAVMKKYYRGFQKDADARRTMDLQWEKLKAMDSK